MTFSGFVFNCLAYLLCWQLLRNLSLTPANRNPEAGNWVPLAAGGLTCAYMLADAMDGKQARRTKTSSCLGEIMDHSTPCLNW
jgi:phosphatidylglycerophosphate synthase